MSVLPNILINFHVFIFYAHSNKKKSLKYAYLHKQIAAMAGINRAQYNMHFDVKIYGDARSRFVYDIQVNVTIKEL